MAVIKSTLTIKEQIDRNKDGRSQKWIVAKLQEMGEEISEVQFSNKKNGFDDFKESELIALSEILGTKLILTPQA